MIRALALVAFVSLACGGKAKPAETTTPTTPAPGGDPAGATLAAASATLESRSGSTATGTARFVETTGGVEATITIAGATPGKHGLHLHETGDCSAPDATSAGGHWNPDQAPHAAPHASPRHAGDLGNIEIGADGQGTLTITLEGLTVAAGDRSVVGRAVILHEKEDDLATQPTGNAGGRIACGVVQVQ